MNGARRHRWLALAIVAAAIGSAREVRAGDPLMWQVPADEGSCVCLVTGGPRGCAMVPSGIPAGQQAQVFHVPWQQAGLIGWRPGLWPINNHGVDVAPPAGARPFTVMDHSILVVYGPDGRTPVLIGEFLPEAEGNWQTHRPGSPKFEEYMDQMRRGRLIPGPSGPTNGNPVGARYGLGDHCCTNTANAQINNPRGGPPARGLNWVGYHMNRCGVTPFIRDNVGRCTDAYRYCNYRFGPGINNIGRCGPDAFNNGMIGGQAGWQLGTNASGLFTDDPYVQGTAGTAGAVWFGTLGVETAVYQNTGQMLLAPRYSPAFHTGRALATGGRGLLWAGRCAAPYAGPVALCATVATVSYCGTRAADDATGGRISDGVATGLCAIGDTAANGLWRWWMPGCECNYELTRTSASMFGAGARQSVRGPARGGGCGGNVAAPNVDPPYEDGGEDLGGCSTGAPGGAGAGALVAIGAAMLAMRRRRRAAA